MSRNPHRASQPLPEYASCVRCGEYVNSALKVIRGQVLCRNCRDRSHQHRMCAICAQELPTEIHHVAMKRQIPSLTITICLNCHAILSLRQKQWDRSCLTERHPLRFLVQGVHDVTRVWLDRSPAVTQCRAFFTMLGHATLIALSYLRLDALAELGAVNFGIGGA
jgi:transcription elongation factor Elf1